LPYDTYSDVINSCYFKDFSAKEKKTLVDLTNQNRFNLNTSKKNIIPATFITNDALTAKLSLLLPALITSTELRIHLVLDLNQPDRKTVLDYLSMINNMTQDSYSNNAKSHPHTLGASYIIPSSMVQHMFKKNRIEPAVNYNNFITALIINLLLCRPKAVFFLFSFGKGLFLKDYQSSHQLAKTLIDICRLLAVKTAYMIIHLDPPIGSSVGGKLELKEVLDAAQGKGSHDLLKLAVEISAELMSITGIFRDKNLAKCHIKQQIIKGSALEKIKKNWRSPKSAFLHCDLKSKISFPLIRSIPFLSPDTGFIQPFPTERIRRLQETLIDRNDVLGIIFNKKTGDKISRGEILATTLFSNDSDKIQIDILKEIKLLFNIESKRPEFRPLIIERGNSG